MRTRRARTTTGLVLVGALALEAACVLVEPPASVPPPASGPPEILHDDVFPPTTAILESWPQEFVVPIYVPDTTLPLQWQAFLDYDPLKPQTPYAYNTIDPDPVGDDGGTRTIYANLQAPALYTCHTLEIVVAYDFPVNHVPDSRGGDTVSWFYAPNGSLEGCPVLDAGPTELVEAGEGGDDGGVP